MPLLLFLLIIQGASWRSNQDELADLDHKLLTAVEKRLGPVPVLTGSSPHSPELFDGIACPSALASPIPPPEDDAGRLQIRDLSNAVAEIARSDAGRAPALRLRALWSLLSTPTAQGRDRAIRFFQAALTREPASPERKNDLAAAYLLRAGLDEKTTDFASALELLDTIRSPTDDALFNRAYALQCLALWDQARRTWPPAGRTLTSGSRPANDSVRGGAPNPLHLRRRGEWLLGEWAAQSQTGAVGARDLIEEARGIASRLQARSGDRLLSAAVNVILQAQKQSDRNKLLRLQSGHAAFHSVRGRAIYSECRPDVLEIAEAQLKTAGSPFAGWVRLDQAVCAYFRRDFRHAEQLLTSLGETARNHSEWALAGRADWILGLIRMVQARFVEADWHYSAAIEQFSRLGEDAHVVYLRSLRAKSFEYGGAPREAWRERLAALRGRRAVDDPERLFTIFDETTQALRRQGYPATARRFLAEQMRAAEETAHKAGDTDVLAFTLLDGADLFAELGARDEALAAVRRAEELWARLAQENESRRRIRLEIDVQQALLDTRTSAEGSLASIDRAIAFLAGSSNSLGNQIEALKLYKLRAQINLRRQRFAEARADLLRGIAEVERQRLTVASVEDRARFLAQADSLFLDLVRLEIDHFRDPQAALAILERSSNRVLAEAALKEPKAGFKAMRRAVPAGTLLVRFGHLSDRVLLWTFLNGKPEFEQRSIAESEFVRQVRNCRDLLVRGAPPVERDIVCNELARVVLPQRLRDLPLGSRVLLIPDEILASLPFAALRTAPGASFLVERFRLSYAPSLTSWLTDDGQELRPPSPPYRTALFVSDPAFSQELFPTLSRLREARHAVAGYASHYAETKILRDRQATVPAVLAALDHFEVFHFDGHGITNFQHPDQGGLLLAPPDPTSPDFRSSLLTAGDLPPHTLRRLRLVVLGACSTGLTTYRETAEATGLAAAFLARGVPEVVAAAWDVPDELSALLLGRFHQERARGRATDEALQAAQLALLRTQPADAIETWAAFQVFQGSL